ncbi:choice-of-anchor G family protein [Agreia sp. COWG]|uniref:choice-of-anchor G family protein n=1 Tax=Agreia sp. COWG TaxID=2773266 RepID=UPI001927C6B2|nr:choice-of-anchor G family protein [Agreia sp. COWG]CAD5991085.1 conserved exported protein of unknown function [Agreia sp. COWG]
MTTRTARRITGTLAGIAALAVAVGASISAAPTDASWRDAEWDHATVSTLDCGPDGILFDTKASGRLVGGRLAGINLDNVAEVDGVSATNTAAGVAVVPAPPASNSLGANAYANPLDAAALNTLSVSLGDLLVLPLNADLGVDNSYAQVNDDGTSTGAAGAVSNSGAIQLQGSQPAPTKPTFATVQLKRVVENALGGSLAGVSAGLADASLSVGAIGSSATLDACAAAWTVSIVSSLQRDYGIANLDLNLTSPTVNTLVTNTTGVLNGLDARVEGLAGDAGLLSALTSNLTTAVSGTLGGLRIGSVGISQLSADLNLAAVNSLLDDTISDDAGIVGIDLAAGTIAIDLDGLLGGANGLNGLAPNTQLLINDAVVNTLTAAVTQALANWVDDVTEAIRVALVAVQISAVVNVNLQQGNGTPLATVALTIPTVSLGSLLAGSPVVTSSVSLANANVCSIPVTGPLLCAALNTLVAGLAANVAKSLGGAVKTALFTPGSGVVDSTRTTLLGFTTPVVTLVANATRGLFGEGSLLSLTANAQNSPAPANANPQPGWSVTGPNAATKATGQYDVAALRLTAADARVQLDLARSSVGTSAPR